MPDSKNTGEQEWLEVKLVRCPHWMRDGCWFPSETYVPLHSIRERLLSDESIIAAVEAHGGILIPNETLAALDFACWEDCESGGDGWARVSTLCRLRGRSQALMRRHLFFLQHLGFVERREDPHAWRFGVFVYAPTEAGAELLQRLEVSGD